MGNDQRDSDATIEGKTGLLFLGPQDKFTNVDAGLVGSSPAFGWAFRDGVQIGEDAEAIALDLGGNAHVTGHFKGTTDFDPGPGTTALAASSAEGHGRATVVAKYTFAGALVWARTMGGVGLDDDINGIAVDREGNVFATGYFSHSADLDPGPASLERRSAWDTIGGSAWAKTDAFVLKLDHRGRMAWARQFGGVGNDGGADIAVTEDGRVIVCGFVEGSPLFEGVDVAEFGYHDSFDAFVMELDGDGQLKGAYALGGSGLDVAQGIAIDGEGAIAVTGFFASTADFDPAIDKEHLLTVNDPQDPRNIFLCKLRADGAFQWARGVGGRGDDRGVQVAADAQGAFHVAGFFEDIVDFDPGPARDERTSVAPDDELVRDGFLWTTTSAGEHRGVVQFGGVGSDSAQDVTISPEGDLYVTGRFEQTVDFDPSVTGTRNLESQGQADAFLARYSRGRDLIWAGQISGKSGDQVALGVASAPSGVLAIVGMFDGPSDLDPTSGLYESMGNGMFVTWILPQPEIELFGAGEPIDNGDTTPSTSDATDMGAIAVDGGSVTSSFTIANHGLALLNLTGSRVAVSGSHAADFTVVAEPAASVPPDGSVSFGLRFAPSALGPRAATVTITSDDADEDTYTFSVTGIGIEPPGASIAGSIWHDGNADGQRQPSDSPFSGAVAELFQTLDQTQGNADDRSLGYLITAANGRYVFPGLLPGVYYVDFRIPSDFVFSPQDVGNNDQRDSEANAEGRTGLLLVGPQDRLSAVDAGLVENSQGFDWGFANAIADGGGLSEAVALGPGGLVHIAGQFSGTVDFDPGPGETSLVGPDNPGRRRAFVSTYSSEGALVWARALGGVDIGDGYDAASGVAVDTIGNVYTTGFFSGTFPEDAAISSDGETDGFVARLGPTGNLGWVRRFGDRGRDAGTDVAVAPDGGVVVGGFTTPSKSDDSEALVLKFGSDGQLLWTTSIASDGHDAVGGVAVGSNGKVYATGDLSYDAFVARVDASGMLDWLKVIGSGGDDRGSAVTLDADGNIYAAGFFSRKVDFDPTEGAQSLTARGITDTFIAKWTSSGQLAWARRFGGDKEGINERDLATDIAVEPTTGHVFVVSLFHGTADFGRYQLTSDGADDVAIIRLDEAGATLDVGHLKGEGGDIGESIVADGNHIYVTGVTSGPIDLDPRPSESQENWTDGRGMFLARVVMPPGRSALGDADGDADVDLVDFGVIKGNFGKRPASRGEGDPSLSSCHLG